MYIYMFADYKIIGGDPEPPASDGPNCGYERKCPLKKVCPRCPFIVPVSLFFLSSGVPVSV